MVLLQLSVEVKIFIAILDIVFNFVEYIDEMMAGHIHLHVGE